MGEWIYVKDRLPERPDEYLVTSWHRYHYINEIFSYVTIMTYDSVYQEWHVDDDSGSYYRLPAYGNDDEKVIAWMPLPDVAIEEGEKND